MMPVKDAQFDERLSKARIEDWSRLAAFIDGEGTVYINRTDRKYRPNSSPRHSLCVVVTNTSPMLMVWLADTFGGSVYAVKHNSNSKKQIFRWQLNHTRAAKVLEGCLPFFIIKRGQAEVGIAFSRIRSSHRRGVRLSESDLAERNAMVQSIRDLNAGKTSSAVM